MSTQQHVSKTCYIRAKREDGTECEIDLIELEDAMEGVLPGESYILLDSGKIVFRSSDDFFDDDEEEETDDDSDPLSENGNVVPIDSLSSHVRFGWMQEFSDQVHSVPLRAALQKALRLKKPFRNFKDTLMEYPSERQRWFQFEADKLRAEAMSLVESLDWEILEVVDKRPKKAIAPQEIDLAERLPLTTEERGWILRGGWQIATRGGRTQLALLLKGSKNKALLKHNLQTSPVYGKLSFLTIEEIENRIDHVIRDGALAVEFFGDLPLIVLTTGGWERVRPWAGNYECEQALAADDKALIEILTKWRNRSRGEQCDLVDAIASFSSDYSQRVLKVWHGSAGKEVRSRIEAKLPH